jgi:hypothetical protein
MCIAYYELPNTRYFMYIMHTYNLHLYDTTSRMYVHMFRSRTSQRTLCYIVIIIIDMALWQDG